MPFVTTNDGVQLFYEETGTGKPILLIGGWTMSTPWWRKQIPALSQTHRVIAVDMRGYGQSDKPEKGYRLARYAKDVHDLLHSLDLNEVTAVGWSLGASTLLAYLDLFGGERLRGVVLIDQTPKILTDEQWKFGLGDNLTPAAADQLLGSIRANHAGFADGFIPGMFAKPPSPEETAWMKAEMLKAPTPGAVAVLTDHCNQDWRDVLPTIQIPVLIIAGKQSGLFSPESSIYMHEYIPNSELMLFEESGHCPFYEEPDKFNAAVAAFAG